MVVSDQIDLISVFLKVTKFNRNKATRVQVCSRKLSRWPVCAGSRLGH